MEITSKMTFTKKQPDFNKVEKWVKYEKSYGVYSRYLIVYGRIMRNGKLETWYTYDKNSPVGEKEWRKTVYSAVPENFKRLADCAEGEIQYTANYPLRHSGRQNMKAESVVDKCLIKTKDLKDLLAKYPYLLVGYAYKPEDTILPILDKHDYFVVSITKYMLSDAAFDAYKDLRFELHRSWAYILKYEPVNKPITKTFEVEKTERFHDVWDRNGVVTGMRDLLIDETEKFLPIKANVNLYEKQVSKSSEEEPVEIEWEGLVGYDVHCKATFTVDKDEWDYTEEALCVHFGVNMYQK